MKRPYLHILSWVIYFTIITLFKINHLEIGDAIRHTLISGTISVALFYFFGNIVVKQILKTKKYFPYVFYGVGLFILFYMLKMHLEVPYFQEYYDLLPSSSDKKEKRAVATTVVLTMLLTSLITVLEHRIKQEKAAQKLLNRHNQAQLSYLKAQINPHFLFNALNNIYSLAVVKSDKAPKMILNLSDLLRYSIYEGQKEKVLIRKEVRQINKYLELFQMTKQEPIDIRFIVLGDIKNERIEPMILIPLVENCIKHGDFDTNGDAFAHITLEVVKDSLRFITKNSFAKIDGQKDGVGGVGLENIKKRLELKYPNSHEFCVIQSDTEFEVLLNIHKLSV